MTTHQRSSSSIVAALTFPWHFVRWAGRVGLWLVFWPLGLWRSIRNGQRKQRRADLRERRRWLRGDVEL